MVNTIFTRKLIFGNYLFLLLPVATLHSETIQQTPLTTSFSEKDTIECSDVIVKMEATTVTKIKILPNKHVAGFVKKYAVSEEAFLLLMKRRSKDYFPMIEEILTKHGLPVELKYLAVIESMLQSKACSRMGARGLWQLMPVTAKELGLRVGGKYDERLHAYRSTIAAAKYLKMLYADLHDWLLVIAAYNSGPGTVYKAIKKSGTRKYWSLQRYLPAESRGHVKRFIGVHYFFEGDGSITTQTKAEVEALVSM